MFPNDIEHTTTAVAPNGSAFALGSPNNAIEIWRVNPPKLYRKIGHGCPLSLGNGGTRLLYDLQNCSGSSYKRTLKCWHADTGLLVDIPDSQSEEQLLSADGMLVLLISTGCVSVHDSNTGSLLFQNHFHEWAYPSMALLNAALSPDANHLAAVVAEDVGITWIHITEMKSGRLKAAYPGTGPLAWSPSGTMLVFQDPDGGIFLWEQSTNDDMLLTFSGHKDTQTSNFVISPDGHLLIPLHTKGEIPLLILTSHMKSNTPRLRFSTDGPVFSEKNGETSLLGMPLGPCPLDGAVDYISESRYLVTAFEISSNGRLIATLSDEGLITIHDANTGKQEGTLQTRLTNANHIQFASDGDFIAVTFKPIVSTLTSRSKSGGRQSEIWNTASRRIVHHSNVYQILRFYPNGHNLVCGSFFTAQNIKTLDLDAANVRGSEVSLGKDAIRIHPTLAFAIQPDVHRLAGIDLDSCSVHVWDTKRLLPPARLDIPHCYEGAPLTELALSPDGRTLAAASMNCILIWSLEAESGLLSPTLVGHESFTYPRPHCLSFSPDSRMLAYASNNAQKLWDVIKLQFLLAEKSPIDNLGQAAREWHGDRYCCVAQLPRILHLYRARDMTGFPDAVEHSGNLRCITADGHIGLFSQPGLAVYVPSFKLPISPILLRLNESQATVSWYWVQKDGQLVVLELPAP
jgi:WD40 repeat protein